MGSTPNTTPDTTPCYLLIPKLSSSSVIHLVIMVRLSMLTLPLLLCSLTTEAQYQCNPDSAGLRQDMLIESSVSYYKEFIWLKRFMLSI